MAIEMLGGPFVGAKAGKAVPGNRGMVFLAARCDLFVEKKTFLENVTRFLEEVRASRLREGADAILVPGDQADKAFARSRKLGVEIEAAIYERLRRLA